MKEEPLATIRLETYTKDGILYLSSKDLPGLWLWGRDPKDLYTSVIPAINALYKYNEGLKVEAVEACEAGSMDSQNRLCDTFAVYLAKNEDNNVSDGRRSVG